MVHAIAPRPSLLTAAEVADRLSCSTYRVYELIRAGHLREVRLGRSIRIDPAALDAFIAAGGTTDS